MLAIPEDVLTALRPTVGWIILTVHSDADPEELPNSDEYDGTFPEQPLWEVAQEVADRVRREVKDLFPRARVTGAVEEGGTPGFSDVRVESVDGWVGGINFFQGYTAGTGLGPMGERTVTHPRARFMAQLAEIIAARMDEVREELLADLDVQ